MAKNGTFAQRIEERRLALKTALVVGLDPVIERFPAALRHLSREEALVAFCEGVIDGVQDQALAVKPQIAFFEQYGWTGLRAFQTVCRIATERGIPVIADAKRGDIGSTAEAYAEAFLGDDPDSFGPFVDALTINPYLGADATAPFLDRAIRNGRGLFLLARTSNAGGAEIQARETDGEPVYLAVARMATAWMRDALDGDVRGYGPLGLVAGVTYPAELGEIRESAPHSLLLLPGLGAQGGQVSDMIGAFDAEGGGALASSSRGIIYAYEQASESPNWRDSIGAEAERQRRALWQASQERAS